MTVKTSSDIPAAPERPLRRKPDPELQAMAKLDAIMCELSAMETSLVVQWFMKKYYVGPHGEVWQSEPLLTANKAIS